MSSVIGEYCALPSIAPLVTTSSVAWTGIGLPPCTYCLCDTSSRIHMVCIRWPTSTTHRWLHRLRWRTLILRCRCRPLRCRLLRLTTTCLKRTWLTSARSLPRHSTTLHRGLDLTVKLACHQ